MTLYIRNLKGIYTAAAGESAVREYQRKFDYRIWRTHGCSKAKKGETWYRNSSTWTCHRLQKWVLK